MATAPRKSRAGGKMPPELTTHIATTANGRDITQPWIGELKLPSDPRLVSAIDWGVYKSVLSDPEVMSTFQQRRRAVVSAEWDVLPGDDQDPRSVECADKLKANLERVALDRVTDKKLYCVFHGISVAELIWEYRDGLWQFGKIKVKHARRFRVDKDDNLRLITPTAVHGELLPERKFWVTTTGSSDDDDPYGRGLAEWLYWPTLFKRNGLKFWNIFLDKFGTPTAKGTYRRGTSVDDVKKLLQALESMATDSGFVVPEGMAVELLQAAKSGTADFEKLCRYMDEAIAKVVLSQTMTSSDGSSLSQAQVHAGVKMEVVKGDADLVCETFNDGPARWWTDFNYGADVESPVLVRLVDEEEDIKAQAETDAVLDGLGWVRTDESFKDTYGDGYEKKPQPTTPPPGQVAKPGTPSIDDIDPATGKPVVDPKLNRDEPQKEKPAAFAASDPRPLYVCRRLKNAPDLIAWAKDAGFKSIIPAAEMHVTVTYSRRPVNWFGMGGSWGPATGEVIVPAGGARLVDPLGSDGAIVLHFASGDIEWRHKEMVENGASWDHPEYLPHVTITYDGSGVDLDKIEPYTGRLVFGPEIFEAIEEDWQSSVAEAAFAEAMARGDIIDGVTEQLLAEQGWTPLAPIMAPIADAIEKAGSAEELDAALIGALDQAGVDKLVETIARAGFSVRLAGETGADEEG